MAKVLAIAELVGESEDVVVSFEEVTDDPCEEEAVVSGPQETSNADALMRRSNDFFTFIIRDNPSSFGKICLPRCDTDDTQLMRRFLILVCTFCGVSASDFSIESYSF